MDSIEDMARRLGRIEALEDVLALPELQDENPRSLLGEAVAGKGYSAGVKARNQLRISILKAIERMLS